MLVAVVTPPPQLNVALLVVDEAVNVSLVKVQVNTAGVEILAFGSVIFCTTETDVVPVQPFAGSVAVTL